MKQVMVNETTGVRKVVKQGFSWTTLFFGIFVPIFRGDIKWFIIMLIAGLVTMGLSWLVFPFIYNGLYIKDLQEKGYKFIDQVK